MSVVELSCTCCGMPLRIETFTGCQIVIQDWYMGIDRYNSDEDLCRKCFILGGYTTAYPGKTDYNPAIKGSYDYINIQEQR